MFQFRFVATKALPRSASFLFRLASAVPSRALFKQPHINVRLSLHPLSKEPGCRFFATSLSAHARSARHSTTNSPPPPPPRPEPEPEPEHYIPPDLPPKKSKEPGSGLSKVFLAITIPILLLSTTGEIARLSVPREEICGALGIDHHRRPPQEAYDKYIRKIYPDKAYWLDISDMMNRNFSFVPRNFAGGNPGEPFRWWTLMTPEFNHAGFVHFYLCYTGFKAFAPVLVQLYGNRVTAACFFLGGIMAETFVGFYEQATNPFTKMSPAEVWQKREAGLSKEDQKRWRRANAWSMGSSTSLMAMGTICAIVYPAMELNLLFIPIGIPIRILLGGVAAFDLGGMIYDYGIPVGHSAHIGGVIAGALLYGLWIRKLPTIMQRRIQQAVREQRIKL